MDLRIDIALLLQHFKQDPRDPEQVFFLSAGVHGKQVTRELESVPAG